MTSEKPMAESTSDYSSALYSIWTVQDSLLQYYRTMFLTAQSLLIAVSASIAQSPSARLALPLLIVGVALWVVWIIVTQQRARDVKFIQTLLRDSEAGLRVVAPFTTFKQYQEDWLAKGAYEISYGGVGPRPFEYCGVWPPTHVPLLKFWRWGTRIHMEVTLPAAYMLGWVVVGIYTCWR